MIKFVKEKKESQLKYCQMVLYTIKYILKTIPSSGFNNYIKIWKKAFLKNSSEGTWQNGKSGNGNSTKCSSSVVFIQPCLLYKNIYKQLKMMYKN